MFLFNSYVRSKLEYASVVWAPGYNIHIDNLERIQRTFLKDLSLKCDGVYPPQGFSHEHLLNRFNYISLKDRRDHHSLIVLYKILNNLIDCPDLLCKFNFNVPRLTSRQTFVFYLSTPRTNIIKLSPVFSMCDKYNRCCLELECDFFDLSLNGVKQVLRR